MNETRRSTNYEMLLICEFTNSGKSSLITSMLGMVDGTAGSITVDGVDLATVPRETLRKRISCITQDSFIFGGSVRLNLDPMGEASDAAIEASLKKVGLWEVMERAVAQGKDGASAAALDLETEGLHLSHGQAQLFCLARALLRQSTVVLLDEPTSRYATATSCRCSTTILDANKDDFRQRRRRNGA